MDTKLDRRMLGFRPWSTGRHLFTLADNFRRYGNVIWVGTERCTGNYGTLAAVETQRAQNRPKIDVFGATLGLCERCNCEAWNGGTLRAWN